MQGEKIAVKIVHLIWKHIQVIRSPTNIQLNYLRNKIKVWEYKFHKYMALTDRDHH